MINRRRSESYSTIDIAANSAQESEQQAGTETLFKPVWTSAPVLAGFILCFAAILAATQALLWLSDKHTGLATAKMNRYYLWTYGPTAILTLVLALWHRVDYRIRQMAPWLAMKGRLRIGDKNMFKDYLSPTTPELFYHSVKNHDFIVTASILVTNLLVLTIVVSTGLLTLVPRHVRHEGISYRTISRLTENIANADLDSFLQLPLNTLDAVDALDLPYPPGTTAELNYQLTESIDRGFTAGDIQEIPVNIVMFDLVCESAKLEIHELYSRWECPDEYCDSHGPITIQNISIHWGNESSKQDIEFGYTNDLDVHHSVFLDYTVPKTHFTLGILDYRQVSLLVNTSKEQDRNDTRNAIYSDIKILRSSQWVCLPHGSSAQATLLYNATSGKTPDVYLDWQTLRPLQSIITDPLLNISTMTNSLSRSYSSPAISTSPLFNEISNLGGDFQTLAPGIFRDTSKYTLDDLFNTDLLLNLTSAYYKRFMVQVAHSRIITADNSTVIGAVIADENRVVTQLTPLRLMQISLAIVILLILYLAIATHKRLIAPYDPTKIAGLLMMLSCQPQHRTMLSGKGHLDTNRLQAMLLKSTISPTSDSNSSDGQDLSLLRSTDTGIRDQTRVRWYQPLTGQKMSRILVCGLLLLVIICLQVLLFYSKEHNGIADVSVNGDLDMTWTFIPAALMVAIATYFRALETTYKDFVAFNRLRSIDSCRPLFLNYPAMTELEVFMHAVRNGHSATAVMAVSIFLSALLTIVVSGVWTASPVPLSSDVRLYQKSWFSDVNSQDNGMAGNSAYFSGLILSVNLSYPQWTYGSLAFGEYAFDDEVDESAKSVRARLPAIRSSLDCTLYHQDELVDLRYIPGRLITPDDVLFGTCNFSFIAPGPADCAYNVELKLLLYKGVSDWSTYYTNNKEGCPYVNYAWGQQDTQPNSNHLNVTYIQVLSCYETIQQAYIGVTLSVPSLELDSNSLDIPPDDDFETFTTANIGIPYDYLPDLQSKQMGASPFFNLIDLTNGITKADYTNPERFETIISAIKHAHPIIRAQQFNAALRKNSTVQNELSAPIMAELIHPGRYRLVQNAISTHILCGLLMGIAVCTSIACLSMSIQYVLPKNPSSIAAMVSLLADSNILDNAEVLQALKERLHRRKRKKGDSPLNGLKFFMGWFDDRADGKRVYTIGTLDRDQDIRPENEVNEEESH